MIVSTWKRDNGETANVHSFRWSYAIEVIGAGNVSENQIFAREYRFLREAENELVNAGFEEEEE